MSANKDKQEDEADCYIQQVYDTIHVYPMDDVEEHNTSSVGVCWCNPHYDYDGYGNRVCIHRQFDDDNPPSASEVAH